MQEIISSGVWIKQADRWHLCDVFKETVRGGSSAVYISENGTEIKREAMSRYDLRLRRRKTGEVLSGDETLKLQDGTWMEAVWFTISSGTGLTVVYVDPETGIEIKREPFSRLHAREKNEAERVRASESAYGIFSATYESYGKLRNISHATMLGIIRGILLGTAEVVSEKYDVESEQTRGIFRISAQLQFQLNVIFDTVVIVYGSEVAANISKARKINTESRDSVKEALLADLSKVIKGDFTVLVGNSDDIIVRLRGYEAVSTGSEIKWERAPGSYVPVPLQQFSRETPVIIFRLQASEIKSFRAALPKVR